MAQKKFYDDEFKIQAVKLGREIGFSKAAKELGVNIGTLYGWNKRTKNAWLDLAGSKTGKPYAGQRNEPYRESTKTQTAEQRAAREISRLKEENEFLAEATQRLDYILQNLFFG